MHYEINVALNGRHFFGTHERSIRDHTKMVIVFKAMRKAFPESTGFTIDVRVISTTYLVVDPLKPQ